MFEDLSLILDCAARMWRFRLGDNQPLGWTITAGYGLASLLSAMVVSRSPFPNISRQSERAFWAFLTVFLAFMCVNKQLELHTYITSTGRCVARAEGWYRERREVQAQFLMIVASVLAVMGVALLFWLRRAIARNGLAVVGTLILFGFILLRAVSLTHVDRLFRIEIVDIRLHRYVELGGASLIIIAALALLLRRRGHD